MLRYVDQRHANNQYESELLSLINKLNSMRALVLEQFSILQHLLKHPDQGELNPKAQTKEIDKDINALQDELDKEVHNILVRHSPQLVELRFILSASKLAGQIERMGDLCKNTVKRLWRAQSKISAAQHAHVVALAAATQPVLDALEALLLHFDDEHAKRMLQADDQVDKAYKELVLQVPHAIDSQSMDHEAVSDILFIAKNLERMADHATAIIREAYYIHHGKRIKNFEAV